jgi:DedD protein
MEEKSELNDIILNKGGSSAGSKKVLMAIATLAIVLIIVIVIMNRISADPDPVVPPTPQALPGLANDQMIPPVVAGQDATVEEDPLFVPVPVAEEKPAADDNINKIAQKLKAESEREPDVEVIEEPKPVVKPVAQPVARPKPEPAATAKPGTYYVQVGSFSKYEPDKKFLEKITKNGYSYIFHKEKSINKVLIGPFKDEKSARSELIKIRKTVKSDAFLKKV